MIISGEENAAISSSRLAFYGTMASSRLARRRQGSVPKESPTTLELSSNIPDPSNAGHHLNKDNNLSNQSQKMFPKHFQLDDVENIKTIGTGTFARVFLCRPKQSIQRSSSEYFALKVLSMHDVIRLKQVDHVKNEKNILTEIQHPFIVELLWYDKDKSLLYMLFPYICGGELFSYLRSAGRFNSSTSLFYAIEIVTGM